MGHKLNWPDNGCKQSSGLSQPKGNVWWLTGHNALKPETRVLIFWIRLFHFELLFEESLAETRPTFSCFLFPTGPLSYTPLNLMSHWEHSMVIFYPPSQVKMITLKWTLDNVDIIIVTHQINLLLKDLDVSKLKYNRPHTTQHRAGLRIKFYVYNDF